MAEKIQRCPYCQAPVVILMLDCPNCEGSYLSQEKCGEIKFEDTYLNPEVIQDLHEFGMYRSWIIRSYAIRQYCMARRAGEMTRDEFKNALIAIKSLMR